MLNSAKWSMRTYTGTSKEPREKQSIIPVPFIMDYYDNYEDEDLESIDFMAKKKEKELK